MSTPKGTPKKRIDLILVERGLAGSRERAQGLILAGQVLVNDTPALKAGHLFPETCEVRVRGQDHPYVSRGGLKLAAALEAFCVSVAGRVAMDVGASTGGFSHVLLLGGIQKIFALDVGQNQMDWKVRSDPRVVVREKTNARYLQFEQIGQKVDIIVVDVSFISLEKILPALLQFCEKHTDLITLVKPQFEVGKGGLGKGGVVDSSEVHQEVLAKIIQFGTNLGLTAVKWIESPITGAEGNKEFLVHWKLNSIER